MVTKKKSSKARVFAFSLFITRHLQSFLKLSLLTEILRLSVVNSTRVGPLDQWGICESIP